VIMPQKLDIIQGQRRTTMSLLSLAPQREKQSDELSTKKFGIVNQSDIVFAELYWKAR